MCSGKNNLFLFLVLLFISCGESLNFNQARNFSMSPSISFPITFFEISATNFTAPPGAPPVSEVSEETNFEVFQNEIIKNNLIKIDWQFEIDNSFSRDFVIKISLLDSNGTTIRDLKELEVKANTLNLPDIETILVSTNSNIKNIKRLRINIRLVDPTRPVNTSESGKFEFKSASTVHLETSF